MLSLRQAVLLRGLARRALCTVLHAAVAAWHSAALEEARKKAEEAKRARLAALRSSDMQA
jgi:division protein CdvB (Snf7/Vps24/ESCRT-III family)